MRFFDQKGAEHVLPAGEPVGERRSAYAWVRRENHVLMVKSKWLDAWELPGGGVEPGESLAKGAARETFEETGYTVSIEGDDPAVATEGGFFIIEDRRFLHSRRSFFIAQLWAETAEDPMAVAEGEIVAVAWMPLSDLSAEACHPMHWEAIIRLRELP